MSKTNKCLIDTTVYQSCPKSCKSVLSGNTSIVQLAKSCIAEEKLNAFLQGEVTFNVGISAFYQSNSLILNRFTSANSENQELISYFLSISEPGTVADILENFSIKVLFELFSSNYENFLNLKDNYNKKFVNRNFFQIKGNQFWKGISFQKICDLILYSIREKNEYSLVSQFIVLLPPAVVSKLQDFTDITTEEERNLFLALGDSIYELPIQSPRIYPHMMNLFQDDPEISIILGTMEELVKRQETILNITSKLIEYYEEHSFGLTIQNIYSELRGLEKEMISEILNQLKEKSVISDSQKEMLQMVFQQGSIDFLKSLKEDILR